MNTKEIDENKKSLTHKVIHGAFWVLSLKVLSKIFSLVRTIVLARLLFPEDFGLMGIIMLSIDFLYRFSQTGFGSALIQKKCKIDDYLDTVWFVTIIRGLLMFLILFFGSSLIANFFENNKIEIYLNVAAFSPLILSFASPKLIYLEKELKFEKKFIYEFSATVVDMTFAIIFAFVFKNVWALLIGLIAGDLTRSILSYFLFPYIPKLKFDIKKAKELFDFGKWIFINGILMFILARGADVLVGKLIGLAALGFYQMATRISTLVSSEIYFIFYQVTFPAYAKIQDNIERLRNAYLRVLQLTSIIVMPITAIIFALAPDLTILCLGEKWIPMISSLKILSFMALFSSLGSTFGSLYMSLGRADIPTKFQMINLAILSIVLYPLTAKWNIEGASIAVLIPSVAFIPINIYFALRMIKCKISDFVGKVAMAILGSMGMCIVIFLSKKYLLPEITYLNLFFHIILGCSGYIATVALIDIKGGYGYIKFFNLARIKKYLGS